MGRRRPDWWSEQQRHLQQHRGDDSPDDECPRNAANARERARMRVLSKAFGRLKTTLPWVPADTKLSKLDTLRLATTYIAHLSSLLATTAPERQLMADRSASTTATAATTGTGPQPQNCNAVMTWPYSAHNTVKECSSPEEEYNRYDCCSKLEDKISYSTYDMYFTSSINS